MNIRMLLLALLIGTGVAYGQALPTSQPGVIEIYMEEIKLGHESDHAVTERGWPAAFERAKYPYTYLALSSLTGRRQVWYVAAYDSHKAIGQSYKLTSENKELEAELNRLNRIDAAHVDSVRIVHARARADLSFGDFPDVPKQRFWQITTFRVRSGQQAAFEGAAKAYGSSAKRNSPKTSFRVYEVLAGLPSPTYVVFSSVVDFGEFDAMAAAGDATMRGMNAQEQAAMEKAGPAILSAETHRFQLDPGMSYVPADVRAQDPGFWKPKE